jgi:hypothetical protein
MSSRQRGRCAECGIINILLAPGDCATCSAKRAAEFPWLSPSASLADRVVLVDALHRTLRVDRRVRVTPRTGSS